jgi:hypothetical protein
MTFTTLLLIEFAIIYTLFIAAENEIKYSFSAAQKVIPVSWKISNAHYIDATVKSIFAVGEGTTFLYPISILLTGALLIGIFYVNHMMVPFLKEFIIMTDLLMAIQLMVPYYMLYLKEKEQSLIMKIPFLKWLDISTRYLSREKSNIVHLNNVDMEKLSTLVKTSETYNEYISITHSTISFDQYIDLLPFFNTESYFTTDNNIVIEVTTDQVNTVEFGYGQKYMSVFKEVDLKKIIYLRYLETIFFFAIVNGILHFGGKI